MHERLEPILRETYGVMIYQEQVMMAARELAGFTMSEADILRAAMGKKDKVKMAKQRTKFIDGAVEREIPPATAEALFDGIAKFAEYGFNRAHSAAYGVIAYQTAYLKANYPLEYMTVAADPHGGLGGQGGDRDRRLPPPRHRGAGAGHQPLARGLLDERGPHPLRSRRDQERRPARGGEHRRDARGGWTVQVARGPVRAHRGDPGRQPAGAGGAGAVGRLRHAWASGRGCSTSSSTSSPERSARARTASRARPACYDLIGSEEEDTSNFGLALDVAPMPGEEKLRLEKELLGLYLSDHPLRRITTELAERSDTQAVEVTSALQDTEVRVAGLVREVRRVVTRKGQIMAYASLEDLTGTVDIVLFPRTFEQVRLLFEPDKVVVVQGKVDARAGSTRATGSAASPIDPEMEAEIEMASIVADMAWLWDDPECLPVARRQLLHVRLAGGDTSLAERLEAVLAKHPGGDEVVLHVVVGSREVVVHADRYHVLAGPALERRDRRAGRRRGDQVGDGQAEGAGQRQRIWTEQEMSEEEEASAGRYIVVKALEDGVVIMGLTRGKDTRSHHSERLDAGEVHDRAVHRADRRDQDPGPRRDPDRRGEAGLGPLISRSSPRRRERVRVEGFSTLFGCGAPT